MCEPRRTDQSIKSPATSNCRLVLAVPAIGTRADTAPTAPIPKVHVTSIQPELPVRRWTTHAPAIKADMAAPCARVVPINAVKVMATIRSDADERLQQTTDEAKELQL